MRTVKIAILQKLVVGTGVLAVVAYLLKRAATGDGATFPPVSPNGEVTVAE